MSPDETHPWLTFKQDLLATAPPELWVLLGEAQSKCEHLANSVLPPGLARKLNKIYLAKGVGGTTAIEGNTLSDEEVYRAINGELHLPPSKKYLQQEIANIVEAFNLIATDVLIKRNDLLSLDDLVKYDELVLSNGVPKVKSAIPGEIRKHNVSAGGYRGVDHSDCARLTKRLCVWLNREEFRPAHNRVVWGIIRAIFAHLYIAWIHPFGDGNGRTARLVEVRLLLAATVPAPAAHLLSNHYNLTRSRYIEELAKAGESGGDTIPFFLYAVQGLVDGLKEQLDFVHEKNFIFTWNDYCRHKLQKLPVKSQIRHKTLVDALAKNETWKNLASIKNYPPVFENYRQNKTDRGLIRDLNTLIKLGLVTKNRRLYAPAFETMRFLRPERF